jgi:hypothetical protein
MSVRRAHCNVVGILKPMFAILRYDVDEVTVNRHGKSPMRSGVKARWEIAAEGTTRRAAVEARLHTSPPPAARLCQVATRRGRRWRMPT